MTVTYVQNYIGVNVPRLHRVVYDRPDIEARYQRSYKDHLVDTWLEENCTLPYYHSPGYLKEKFIEFVDDKEALLFSLRWGA